MAKVFTIPVPPYVGRRRRERESDPRYVDGQRVLVEAMKYLAQSDPIANREAVQAALRACPYSLPHDRLSPQLRFLPRGLALASSSGPISHLRIPRASPCFSRNSSGRQDNDATG